MDRIEKQTKEIITEAGDMLLAAYRKPKEVSHKGKRDLVTETDKQVNEFLMKKLTGICDSGFLGEEGSFDENKPTRWIVDPIDGTTNFIHSYPMFCVSIGLEVDGVLELGIVYLPVFNTMYHARRGHGAYENHARIHVSPTETVGDALLSTGFPYKDNDLHNVMRRLETMIRNAQGIRRSGSAAIDLCHLARGYIDAFWEQGLKPWDTAGGTLLVREAGGSISNYNGDEYSYNHDTIIASNGMFHLNLVELLK